MLDRSRGALRLESGVPTFAAIAAAVNASPLAAHQMRQPSRDAGRDDQHDREQNHDDRIRDRALDDVGDRPAVGPYPLYDEQIHADRRRDQTELAHQHDEHAEPDRIDPGRRDYRERERDRSDHHRQRVHEHAEQEIEHDQQHQDLHAREPEAGDVFGDRLADPGEAEREIEHESADDDQQDHAGGSRTGQKAGLQNGPRQLALHYHQQERHHQPERGGFGCGRDAEIEASHHGAEHRDRFDEVAQQTNALFARDVNRLDLFLAYEGRDEDVHHEQAGQHEPRNDAGDEQLAGRRVGHRAIDDEVDARRNHDAERAAGGETAECIRHRIAVAFERGQRDRANGGGGRDRGAGGRGEQRAAADIGVQKSAGQAPEPYGEYRVHAVRHAGAQQEFAEQHEQRDRGQPVLAHRAPGDRGGGVQKRHAERHHAAGETHKQHDGADRKADQHQADHDDEADDAD